MLTPLAFNRLLEFLDDGVDSQGERYLEMRRRLVSYFSRRNRPAADELADETLSRMATRLEQTGALTITPPARCCYAVARFVLLEDIRRGNRRHVPFDEARPVAGAAAPRFAAIDEGAATREQRLDCLDRCLRELTAGQRELVIEYYRDGQRAKIERRRRMAERLGITKNALGIRAFRIRETLMTRVESCRERQRQADHLVPSGGLSTELVSAAAHRGSR